MKVLAVYGVKNTGESCFEERLEFGIPKPGDVTLHRFLTFADERSRNQVLR